MVLSSKTKIISSTSVQPTSIIIVDSHKAWIYTVNQKEKTDHRNSQNLRRSQKNVKCIPNDSAMKKEIINSLRITATETTIARDTSTFLKYP